MNVEGIKMNKSMKWKLDVYNKYLKLKKWESEVWLPRYIKALREYYLAGVNSMDDLTKLAIKYGTDKWGKHNYTPHYYEMFKDRRESVKKVLEIGVGEGAGLRMWRDFFPNAMIYGAEIDDNRVVRLSEEDRISVFKCDQSKSADLKHLIKYIGSDIDLVVDDGSHKPEHQAYTCRVLMSILNEKVTYVIEDVADEDVAIQIMKNLPGYYVNVKKVGKRYDDRLCIVGKIR